MSKEGPPNSIDQRLLEAALTKANGVLSRDEIRMSDFVDLYGSENVRNDESYVRQREQEFLQQETPETKQAKELALVFEALIHEHGEQSDWFGPYATTVKASRYDDIANRVDSIIEFQEPQKSPSQLALAVDVTYSHQLAKKFEDIKREIETGKLTQIKYFYSENTGIRGEKSNVPRIIVGADPAIVQALAGLWLEGQNSVLGKHPIQFQIIDEAIMQCRAFAEYAKTVGQPDVAARYENDLRILEEIYKEKNKSLRDTGMRDGVWEEIKKHTDSL